MASRTAPLWRRGIRVVERALWHATNHFSRGNLHRWVAGQRKLAGEPVLNVGAGGQVGRIVATGRCTSIDIAPERGPDVVADVCDLGAAFEPESFESVFLVEVLEHVLEPRRALEEIHRVLRPGGLLVLSTPYIFEMHDLPHDYWRFTEHGLRHLLADFEDVVIERRNGYVKTAITPLLRLTNSPHGSDRILGAIALVLAYATYPLLWLGDACVRSDLAATGYHVTARKPGAPDQRPSASSMSRRSDSGESFGA